MSTRAIVCALAMAAGLVVSGVAGSADSTDAAQWTSVGRTSDEQRFSPLTQINKDNVTRLGLAWFADFDTNRGQEATPLAIDGVLYVSTAWSKVKAYDARTGRLLWGYDPMVPGEFAGRATTAA
jgi:quinohemoprotein ethanol dehydrogenase